MVMLIEASMIHSAAAAIHSTGALGMITRARLVRMAPQKK